jgi:hypothetical protein
VAICDPGGPSSNLRGCRRRLVVEVAEAVSDAAGVAQRPVGLAARDEDLVGVVSVTRSP